MPHLASWLALAIVVQSGGPHESNPIYRELLDRGLEIDGSIIRLPAPTLPDGQGPEAAAALLEGVAGNPKAVREMLRDSITAPFILKSRDIKAGRSTIRVADLWFVVHARLEDVDLDRAAGQAGPKTVEAGNMRFETRILPESELAGLKLKPLEPKAGRTEWYVRLSGRLLDRIGVEATDRVVATRTPESIVVAARTETSPDRPRESASRWMTLARKANEVVEGPPQRYGGGISYTKVTRYAPEPGALLVEAHFAFDEPIDWFQGNPILRSKIGLIAQDQVRQLRRELRKDRPNQ